MLLGTYEWGDPDAPPPLCVHGVAGSADAWRRLAEERWSRHFRVIAVDLRGHGDSGWEPQWTFPTLLAGILGTLDHLGVAQPHWVGRSVTSTLKP